MQFGLGSVLIGLLLFAIGIVMVRYSYPISRFTGAQEWIERKAGPGTTSGVYKLFGAIAIFFGMLFVTGLDNSFFPWLLSPLRSILGGLGNNSH